MFLTQRQKRILQILLENPTGVSIKQLENNLKISRRTVYREFGDLKQNNFDIVNQKGKYFLPSSSNDLQKVKQDLQDSNSQTLMSIAKREKVIAAKLLLSPEPCKIVQFALDLNVSEATIQNDLNAVAKSLSAYQIKLVRKKSVGLSIQAPEDIRRQVFVDIVMNEINGYDFFTYLRHNIESQDPFLTIIDKRLLLDVYQNLKAGIFDHIKIDTDQKMIELILIFATTLIRSDVSCKLPYVKLANGALKYEGYVYHFMALFSQNYALKIDQNDISYLANKLLHCDYQNDYLTYGNHELAVSVKVKNFVEAVSEEVHWNFERNPNFMTKLTKHIVGLVEHRVALLPDMQIDSLTDLNQRFPELYHAILENWQKEFPDNQLTQSEFQLILLYFANEYTKSNLNRNLSALVICENGIGTSAILSARLKKEFPEIKHVKIGRVSILDQLDLSKYDVIFSTLKLKDFSREYQLVSPLLLDDEIACIKNYLKTYEQKFPIRQKVQVKNKIDDHSVKKLSRMSINALFCLELVNGIRLQQLEYNSNDLIAVIQECLAHSDSTLIHRQMPVAKNLLKRVRMAPVGIPNSHIALLHTRSAEVTRCSLTMFDLDNEISLRSMDHSMIQVKRVLLMLTPDNLSESEERLMSMISSMIIMNDANLTLFANGSQEDIQNAIAALFLQDLQKGF